MWMCISSKMERSKARHFNAVCLLLSWGQQERVHPHHEAARGIASIRDRNLSQKVRDWDTDVFGLYNCLEFGPQQAPALHQAGREAPLVLNILLPQQLDDGSNIRQISSQHAGCTRQQRPDKDAPVVDIMWDLRRPWIALRHFSRHSSFAVCYPLCTNRPAYTKYEGGATSQGWKCPESLSSPQGE